MAAQSVKKMYEIHENDQPLAVQTRWNDGFLSFEGQMDLLDEHMGKF